MRWLLAIAIAASRAASADPVLDHVIDVPTAWLPHAGDAYGSAALDHHAKGSIVLGYGFGGVGALEVGADNDIHQCSAPPCNPDNPAGSYTQGFAAFRMGVPQDRVFYGQPAVLVGYAMETLRAHHRVAQAYLVASRLLGPVALHSGAQVFDAQDAAGMAMGARVVPFGAIEYVPAQYPKTTMMADIGFLPELATPTPVLKSLAGVGVRYQALTWGSIELDWRVRQFEDAISDSAIMVRVNGVWRAP